MRYIGLMILGVLLIVGALFVGANWIDTNYPADAQHKEMSDFLKAGLHALGVLVPFFIGHAIGKRVPPDVGTYGWCYGLLSLIGIAIILGIGGLVFAFGWPAPEPAKEAIRGIAALFAFHVGHHTGKTHRTGYSHPTKPL